MDDEEIAEIAKIVNEIGMKYDGRGLSMKTGEVFPTDNAPVVKVGQNKPALHLMKWGFPKHDGKGVVINARSETASQKRMFAASFAAQRCVVPSTGFIEWAKENGKPKGKIRFNLADSPMLYMAGLYSEYPAANENEYLSYRFVILTREANESISEVHSRMPVILYKNEIRRWLTDDTFANGIIRRDTVGLVGAVMVPS